MTLRTVSSSQLLPDRRAHRGLPASATRLARVLWVAVFAVAAVACAGSPTAAGPYQAPAAAQPAPAQQAMPAQPAEAKPVAAQAQPAKPAAAAQPATEKPAQPAASASQQRLFVGSTNTTSSYYTYHVAEATYLNAKVPDVSLTVVETGGGADNIGRLARGDVHISLMSGGVTYQAHQGVGDYTGKQVADLRYLWMYTVGARVIIVSEQSGVTKFGDLAGKPFNAGLARGATEKDFKAHADILGVKPQYYTAGLEDAVQAMKDRRIVGLVKAQPGLTVDSSTLDLMVFVKIRPVGYSDEEIKKITEKRPWDPFLTVQKDEWAKGFPTFKTLASAVGTGTTKNLPEEIAYKLTKAMMEPSATDEIAKAAPFIKGWEYRKRTIQIAPIPLHRGAVRYFREVGETVPEQLLPPEAK